MTRRFKPAAAAATVATGLASQAATADLITPAGLNAGDKFTAVFVTSGTIDATSGSTATYDAFVQAAAAAGTLNTYNGQSVTQGQRI